MTGERKSDDWRWGKGKTTTCGYCHESLDQCQCDGAEDSDLDRIRCEQTEAGESLRRGGWIQTFTGVHFYPLDPRPCEILIEDIAHALSMQCRYSGHVNRFYSVAEHSIRVAELVPRELRLLALMHDAAEAYLVDLPRPLKRYSDMGAEYKKIEDHLMIAVCERFRLAWQDPMPDEIERADKGMLWVESRDLMTPDTCWDKWRKLTTGLERPITTTMTPASAEKTFLRVFEMLA